MDPQLRKRIEKLEVISDSAINHAELEAHYRLHGVTAEGVRLDPESIDPDGSWEGVIPDDVAIRAYKRAIAQAQLNHDKEELLGGSKMEEKMVPIPSYGSHMAMEEFIGHVEVGGFMDHDGHGSYATETEMLREPYTEVLPSMVAKGTIDRRWSHIVWFNK